MVVGQGLIPGLAEVGNQGWDFAHRFSEQIARLLRKKLANERFAQKNERFAHLLIFGEQPDLFAHIAHYKRGNGQITLFFFKHTKNIQKNTILDF